MNFLKRYAGILAVALILSVPVVAQNIGTVSNHCVAVGKGAGKTGLTSVCPTSAGQGLKDNGASADPSFGTITPTFTNQSANTVLAGPTSGSAAVPTFRSLVGADLPNPGASALGGIRSYAAVSNQWINSISTSGVPASAQPNFTDLAGSLAIGQVPNSLLTYAKIQNVAALSLFGNATNSSAVGTDITAASDNQIMRRSGTAIGFGSIDLSQSNAVGSSVLPIANGGCNAATAQACTKNLNTWYAVCHSGVTSAVTGTTSETTLATCAIPANSLGANGSIKVTAVTSQNNNANAKTFQVRFDGNSHYAVGLANTLSGNYQITINNKNATNSQVSVGDFLQSFNAAAVAVHTTATDTTASKNITLTGTLANSADNITLQYYIIEVLFSN